MVSFIDFLNGNVFDDAAGLMADLVLFLDDPDSFNKLSAEERKAYEQRVDAALSIIMKN